jgi:hypothetical protein
MNNSDAFVSQLEDYLDEFDGVTPLPDRVRNAIRAELPSARQVRPRPGQLRSSPMPSTMSFGARLGLAAAAVVAVAVLGAVLFSSGRSGQVGGPPTATPTLEPSVGPTSRPTPRPTAASGPPTLEAAAVAPCDASDTANSCIAAGTYQLSGGPSAWPAMVTVDVPAGWFEWGAGPAWDAVLVADAQGDASGWGVMFYTVRDVARDPCDLSKGFIPAAQVDAPAQLAATMAAWPGFTATAPLSVKIDGHSSVKFQLTLAGQATCGASAAVGHSTAGATVDAYPMTELPGIRAPATVEIIDTGNGLLVLRATDFTQASPAEIQGGQSPNPNAHAGDLGDLHAILDSIRITAWPSA